MKIPLFIPGRDKKLNIDKKYFCKDVIIPIGCDCHPTFLLNKLHLRNQSLPFDWLSTKPLEGIRYVSNNLKNDFEFYLDKLRNNERGFIVSEKYAYTEFVHETDLIDSIRTQNKFRRRIQRFKELIENYKNIYLYNITSSSINSEDELNYFIGSVNEFVTLIKHNDSLHIYIRYDESYDENKIFCEALFNKLKKIDKVCVAKNIRYKDKYGIWGNEKDYVQLMSDLNIQLKSKLLPKIYIQ